MGKREIQKKKELALLEVIKTRKAVLFGNFKNVTNTEKQKAWEAVLFKAQSLELASAEKTWTHARDNLFGLWKSRTLSKRDNMCRTGTGGGSDKTLDEIDYIILDILGKESKVVDGLGLPESGSKILIPSGGETDVDEDITSENCKNLPSPVSIVAPCETNAPIMNIDNTERPPRGRKRTLEAETGFLSNKKIYAEEAERLKVELLKVEVYHRKLQARKLEKELGLPYSEFTKDFQ